MWKSADEAIKKRVEENIINTARSRMIVYLLLLMLVDVLLFVSLKSFNANDYVSPALLAVIVLFFGVGLVAIFYIYFTTVRENAKLLRESVYMVVGTVISPLSGGDKKHIIVKIPQEAASFSIECEPELYKNAVSGKRVLVFSASKKNSAQMYGVDPATYDKDGIL